MNLFFKLPWQLIQWLSDITEHVDENETAAAFVFSRESLFKTISILAKSVFRFIPGGGTCCF